MRITTARATWLAFAICLLTSTTLASPVVAVDWDSLPRCQWALMSGPLKVGCVTGYTVGPAVGPDGPLESEAPTILTAQSLDTSVAEVRIVAPHTLQIASTGAGATQVCYTFAPRPWNPQETKRCFDVAVGSDVAPTCGARTTTPDGYVVSTRHLHVGCPTTWSAGSNDMSGQHRPVTRVVTSDASVMQVAIQPYNSGGRSFTGAAHTPVGAGRVATCYWWDPLPGIPGDGGPACFVFTVHPLTKAIVSLPRSDNEPRCNLNPAAATAHLQMACSGLLPVDPGTTATSSNPSVIEVKNYAFGSSFIAAGIGTSDVCFTQKGLATCIAMTSHLPTVDVTSMSLNFPSSAPVPSGPPATPPQTSDATSQASGAASQVPTNAQAANSTQTPIVTITQKAAGVSVALQQSGSKHLLVIRTGLRPGTRITVVVAKPDPRTGEMRSGARRAARVDSRGRVQITVATGLESRITLTGPGGRRMLTIRA